MPMLSCLRTHKDEYAEWKDIVLKRKLEAMGYSVSLLHRMQMEKARKLRERKSAYYQGNRALNNLTKS